MKIAPLFEALKFSNRVQEKPNAEGNHRDSQGQNPEQQQKDEDKAEVHAVSDFEVEAAIEAFGTDAQAKIHGLKADLVGKGPGLRVVLKDGQGAIIRQFTGEEFLKLREASGQDGRARGKILDQKL